MDNLHKPWYKETKPHECVFNTVARIDEAQSYRYDQNLENLRFYSNRLVAGLYGADYALQDSGDRLKVNVVQSIIDTSQQTVLSRCLLLTMVTTPLLEKQKT